jgi:oxepin-CoA hydrolase/3-oxo-5,6-dehydrosuberyl-CoA semialdehyde dehydrogenase
VTDADIVNFAGISGDFFYAHMDDIAARDSIFERRVAHGYFVLSAAAGLFVDPAPGPVLANYGLDTLRFVKPVYPGDTIQATLTVKQKTAKEKKEGSSAGRCGVGCRGSESDCGCRGCLYHSHARAPERCTC